MSAELFLFDDRAARKWLPFALTRPVGEMLFGTRTLRGRAERATGLECRGHVTSRDLVGFCEPEAPPIATPESVRPDRDRLLLSSRLVLNDTALAGERGPAEPRLLAARGTPAGAWIPAGTPFDPPERVHDQGLGAGQRQKLLGTLRRAQRPEALPQAARQQRCPYRRGSAPRR